MLFLIGFCRQWQFLKLFLWRWEQIAVEAEGADPIGTVPPTGEAGTETTADHEGQTLQTSDC